MNWKGAFKGKFVVLSILVVSSFQCNQNVAALADERKQQVQEVFPSSPPKGICYLTIHDDLGNAVKIALWGENDRFFWYFEPMKENFGDYCLYPGDIRVTQDGKLYEEVKFIDKVGVEFWGHIREPLLFEFTACGWIQIGVQCVNYDQPFEMYLPPGNHLRVTKNKVKLNSSEVKR